MPRGDDYYVVSTEYDPVIGYSDDTRAEQTVSDSLIYDISEPEQEESRRLVIDFNIATKLYDQLKSYDNTPKGGRDSYRLKHGLVGLLYTGDRSEKVMITRFLNTEKMLLVTTLYGRDFVVDTDSVSVR